MKPSNWLMLALLVACIALAAISALFELSTWLEAVSVVTGAACVWLTVKESIWNFPVSLLNVSTFCVVFFRVGLYADASLQIIYFVLTVIGWYMWVFGGEKRTALKITRTSPLESALVLTSVASLTIGFWFTLQFLVEHFGGSITTITPSFWDAFTTAICLGAQWLLNRKKLENWILWIIADVIYVPLYLSKGLYLTSGLYAVFLVMATIGLVQWIQKYRKLQLEKVPENFGFPVETAAPLGVVIGKFYPPHHGHKFLIDSARAQCDRLVVILPYHPSQQIPGELRRDWLAEIHPTCEIHLVPDELEDDSKQWADWTIAHLGRAPDVVFTSEDYGPRYAEFMGARHVMIDKERANVPCSGTQIRSAPLDHLDLLEPCVRAYFVRRIVLIGAESTGKTTLAAQLADHYKTQWVPEFGREYWEKKVASLSMDSPLPPFASEEFLTIAAEQQHRENLAVRTANKILICDTNALATGTWHERYMNFRNPAVDAIGNRDTAHLYLLAHPDFPFVQDGFRDGEKIRDWMHARFINELAKTAVPIFHLTGSQENRLATAMRAVDKLIADFKL